MAKKIRPVQPSLWIKKAHSSTSVHSSHLSLQGRHQVLVFTQLTHPGEAAQKLIEVPFFTNTETHGQPQNWLLITVVEERTSSKDLCRTCCAHKVGFAFTLTFVEAAVIYSTIINILEGENHKRCCPEAYSTLRAVLFHEAPQLPLNSLPLAFKSVHKTSVQHN